MAVGDDWMVHYLNAGMATDPVKRAEEAAVMAGFDEGFAARHADALAEACTSGWAWTISPSTAPKRRMARCCCSRRTSA